MSKHRLSKRKRTIAWAVAGVTVAAGGALTATAVSTTTTAAPKLPAPSLYSGRAFDTCTAPSLSAMKAWKTSSFYGAIAVYMGGKNRGCAQPQLTPSWVKSVSASGWKLIPLYVGAQPPCQTGRSPEKIAASTAASQGAANGADAVAKAGALGMKPGSPLYLDMEPYDINNSGCNNAVLSYVRAWNRAVHAKGYWAGYYGFKSTSAHAVATATDRTDMPDILWYANWNDVRTTTRDWAWNPTLWTGHRRAHQYSANRKETIGGVTLTVDRNDWDAPVAIIAK
ncbi:MULTISPECIES: glycoside hydrolase domain-containing protein [Streptomyces]|uniref:glycoside hydrolase domain-containing protein n=1 Tax=Streptomyces TaxID=1883 RepID=UPI0007CD9541|nr:peptidoglycan-binding protein [Streptomyces noursei]